MSDPKAMTLEEAVEIDRKCSEDSGMGVRIGRENMDEWHRARAIVDQAVVFSKAYTKLYENYEYGDGKVLEYEFKRFRALERGESEGKP